MMFKITSSASDSLSTLGSIVLLISFEDEICLKSIPGWEPDFSEEKDIVQTSLPSKGKSVPSIHFKLSKEICEQPTVTNGLHIERVRRKIFVDEVVPQKSLSDGIISERDIRSLEPQSHSSRKASQADADGLSKRPRSLPDFKNYTVEGRSVDSVLPYNGKESVAKEAHRLKSLASACCKSLQKDSPKSRSLNSISDTQNQITSFRGKSDAQTDFIADLRNISVQLHSPKLASKSSKNGPNKQSDIVPTKRSCVRRLNLDDSNSLSQDFVVVGKNKLQPSVERKAESVGSSECPVPEKVTSKLALKKQQLGSTRISQCNDKNLSNGLHISKEYTVPKSIAFSQPRSTPGIQKDLPECSQQYTIGPETQRVLVSNFEDDSFCISEKPKGDSNDCDTALKSATVGVSRDTHKHNSSEINLEADKLQTSEDLFSGSQGSVHNDLSERDKTGRPNDREGSQRTESVHYNLKHLRAVSSVVRSKSSIKSRGLSFTKSQIKSMCDVISRLYGSSE